MGCILLGSSVHGVSQQEYWSGLPFPSPGDLPDPGIKAGLPTLNHLGHQGISAVFHSEGPYVSNLWILTAFLYVPDTCSAQSCPMLCDLMDCSPPGSSVHRIFWARILKWVAISYSRGLPYLTYNSNSFWMDEWTNNVNTQANIPKGTSRPNDGI